jgi:hypothetical protein
MSVTNILSKATERSRELVVAEIIQKHYESTWGNKNEEAVKN